MPPEGNVTALAGRQSTRKSPRKPKARVGDDKQEMVEKPQVIKERIDELVELKMKADSASTTFGDAIKKAAQDSGLLASVVRSFVVARVGEKYQEANRRNTQLALLFDEVGE